MELDDSIGPRSGCVNMCFDVTTGSPIEFGTVVGQEAAGKALGTANVNTVWLTAVGLNVFNCIDVDSAGGEVSCRQRGKFMSGVDLRRHLAEDKVEDGGRTVTRNMVKESL